MPPSQSQHQSVTANDVDQWERQLAQPRKRRRKMIVSGKSVKLLQQIISNKTKAKK